MPSNAPDLNFGPSERYLPGKKLLEGDVLTLNIMDMEREEVDTEYGSKLQFRIHVISSSNEAISTDTTYIWRTVTSAARKVHEYYTKELDMEIKNFSHWVWELNVLENGIQLKTLSGVSV